MKYVHAWGEKSEDNTEEYNKNKHDSPSLEG